MARSRHLKQVELRYNFVSRARMMTPYPINLRHAATRIQAAWRRLNQEAQLFFRVSVLHLREQRSINKFPREQRFPYMLRRADEYDARMNWWRNNQTSLTSFHQLWNAFENAAFSNP